MTDMNQHGRFRGKADKRCVVPQVLSNIIAAGHWRQVAQGDGGATSPPEAPLRQQQATMPNLKAVDSNAQRTDSLLPVTAPLRRAYAAAAAAGLVPVDSRPPLGDCRPQQPASERVWCAVQGAATASGPVYDPFPLDDERLEGVDTLIQLLSRRGHEPCRAAAAGLLADLCAHGGPAMREAVVRRGGVMALWTAADSMQQSDCQEQVRMATCSWV